MSGDLIWAVVRMLLALPVVLGLIYLVLKYGLARRYVTPAGRCRMKLVEQLPLGPKSTLSLVTLGGVYYLLAHQENSISLVKELSELPEVEQLETAGVMELTPHSVQDYDLGRTTGDRTVNKYSPGRAGEIIILRLKKLGGQISYMRRYVKDRLTGRATDGGKGEKKIEN